MTIWHCHSLGKYLYVEASSPAQEGDEARLISGQFPATAGRCLSFWYHMYGSSTGTLNVYILDKGGKKSLIWSKSGEQGDKWIQAKLSLTSRVDYQVSGLHSFLQFKNFFTSSHGPLLAIIVIFDTEQERKFIDSVGKSTLTLFSLGFFFFVPEPGGGRFCSPPPFRTSRLQSYDNKT